MKTNKSYSKRLRLTRKGKIVSRTPGQNHFNAKQSGRSRQHHKRASAILLDSKLQSRFLS